MFFSIITFFSLWDNAGFTAYRWNLAFVNLLFGLLTLVIWDMVGVKNADWNNMRDYVWAT